MATEREIIREFMVALGYHIEPIGARRFIDTLTNSTKLAGKTAAAVIAVAAAAEAMVQVFSRGMEKMYYASKRTQTSVQNLKAIEFAFSQIGLSGDEALATVEAFSQGLRTNPGLSALLKNLGVKVDGRDRVAVLYDTIEQLSKMPHFIGAQWAEQFGIPEHLFLQMKQHLPELRAAHQKRIDMARAAAIDEKAAAEAAKEYMNALRETWEKVELLWGALSIKLLPAFREFTGVVNEALKDFTAWANSGFTTELDSWKDQFKSIAQSGNELLALLERLKLLQLGKDLFSGMFDGASLHALLDLVDGLLALASGNWSKAADKLGNVVKYNVDLAKNMALGVLGLGSSTKATQGASGGWEGGAGAPNAPATRPSVTSSPVAPGSALHRLNQLEELYNLPQGLLDRMWAQESGRGVHMLSPKGAKGHFGFMDPTAKAYGVKDPMDFGQSSSGAARMMRDLLQQYGGDLSKALAGYNWGSGNIQKFGMANMPPETRNYIDKVGGGGLTVNQNTTINVPGSGNPVATARAVGDEQNRVYATTLRNLKGAVR